MRAHLFDNKIQYCADANVIKLSQEASAGVAIGQSKDQTGNLPPTRRGNNVAHTELPEPNNVLNPYNNEIGVIQLAEEFLVGIL